MKMHSYSFFMGMGFSKLFMFLTLFSSFHFFVALSNEFSVGAEKGWVIPSAKNDQFYNEWASKNRFTVNDTLKFEYQKDSVMVVSQEEYEKCRSVHPVFFSNDGNTVYKLDRAGLFYFISGVSGHCERGLKMVIKVLELETPPQSDDQTAGNSPPATGGVTRVDARLAFLLVSVFGTIIFV